MARFNTWMKWLLARAQVTRADSAAAVRLVWVESNGPRESRPARQGLRVAPSVMNCAGVMSRKGAAVFWYLTLQVCSAELRWSSVCGNRRVGIGFYDVVVWIGKGCGRGRSGCLPCSAWGGRRNVGRGGSVVIVSSSSAAGIFWPERWWRGGAVVAPRAVRWVGTSAGGVHWAGGGGGTGAGRVHGSVGGRCMSAA